MVKRHDSSDVEPLRLCLNLAFEDGKNLPPDMMYNLRLHINGLIAETMGEWHHQRQQQQYQQGDMGVPQFQQQFQPQQPYDQGFQQPMGYRRPQQQFQPLQQQFQAPRPAFQRVPLPSTSTAPPPGQWNTAGPAYGQSSADEVHDELFLPTLASLSAEPSSRSGSPASRK